MPNRFATGWKAISICDRCGQQYPLKQLREQIVKTKNTNLMVCPSCLDPDHPQLLLGMFPVDDPQALRNPRPDSPELIASRDIYWGWNPVGGGNVAIDGGTPNPLVSIGETGTVTVVIS
jgi:hypothetical protein